MLSQSSFWKRSIENSNNLILGFLVLLFSCSHLIGFSQAVLPTSRTSWLHSAHPAGWTHTGTTQRTTTSACTGNDGVIFDNTGDRIVLFMDSDPDILTFKLNRQSMSGESFMTVERSNDGTSWTSIGVYGTASGATAITNCGDIALTLPCGTRYIRWTYTKATGNCDMDDVSVTKNASCTPCLGCSIDDAGLTSVSCNNNSTNDITTDDIITFSLNPSGCDLSATYNVAVSGGGATSISPTSASYGSATAFTLNTGSAGGGNVTVTITDASGASCFMDVVIGDPGTCSCATGCLGSQTCIKINEFVYRPDESQDGRNSDTGEWIELRNTCDCEVDISCMVLCSTDVSSGNKRGECITLPSSTFIAAGGVYLLGGYGTNCTGGMGDCAWPGLALNYNWHDNASSVWSVSNDVFYTTNINNFIGVLTNSGEDISLFNSQGLIVDAVTYNGGTGASSTNTENIGAIGGCAAKSITIPTSANHTATGTVSGTDDGGRVKQCDNSWIAVNKDELGDFSPGSTPEACPLIACITLLSSNDILLTGKGNENENSLIWTTSIDLLAEYFILEKSFDNSAFTTVEAISNSNNTRYSYTDRNPYATSYYRIAVVQENGAISYSNTIVLTNKSKANGFSVSNIAPNPANTQFSFNFNLVERGASVMFKMYNVLGELVMYKELFSSQVITLQTEQLESGMYYLVFSSDNEQQSHKLLIQH